MVEERNKKWAKKKKSKVQATNCKYSIVDSDYKTTIEDHTCS